MTTDPRAVSVPVNALQQIYDACLSGKFYSDYDRACEMTGWLKQLAAPSSPAAQAVATERTN